MTTTTVVKTIELKSVTELPANAMRYYTLEWEAIAEAERIGAQVIYHDAKTGTWFVVAMD